MGVDYYPCHDCEQVFSDSGGYVSCEDCGYKVGPCCMPDDVKEWTKKTCPHCRGLEVMTKRDLLPFLAKRAGYSTVKEARRALQRSERKKYLLKKQAWIAEHKARRAKRAAERAECKKEYGSETSGKMTRETQQQFLSNCSEGKHKEWELIGTYEENTTDDEDKEFNDGADASDPEVELKTLADV